MISTKWILCVFALVAVFAPSAVVAQQDGVANDTAQVPVKAPPAVRAKPIDQKAWARKLAGLKDHDWRTAFQVGLDLADLPPDDGFAIVKDNWKKIRSIEARQQILKAWYYTMPYPLHARNHPRILEVLDLGMHDKSPKVKEWAQNFLRETSQVPEKSKLQAPDPELVDVADVPALDLRAGGDEKKRYFLIGVVERDNTPVEGYALLIVLPGGDGSADVHPFIRRIYKNVLAKRWLIAQPVAPKWDENQFDQIVWPTERQRYPAAKFTTEDLVQAVVTDVRAKAKVDPKRVFLLGWSSGGPPCYATVLRKKTPATAAFIAMSVFKPEQMPALGNAKGKPFYLLQSPDDQVTPMQFAEAAEKALQEAGAKVQLQRYAGGHGWRGNVYQMLGDGIEWLDKQAEAKP